MSKIIHRRTMLAATAFAAPMLARAGWAQGAYPSRSA